MHIREGSKNLHKELQSLDSACFLPAGSPSTFSVTPARIPENLCKITRKNPPGKGLKHPSRGIIFVGRPTRKDHTKLASRGEPSFHILRHPDRQETNIGMARLRSLLPLPPSRDVQPFGYWCFAVPDALVERYIISLVKRVLLTPLFLSQVFNPAQCLSSRKMSCFIHRFIATQDYIMKCILICLI